MDSEPKAIKSLAVFAPAGPVPADRMERGIEVLRALGVEARVFLPPEPRAWLAGTDSDRLESLRRAMDCGADALMAARGGYGSFRLLQAGWDRRPPRPGTPVIGFSDLTALLLALSQCADWLPVHGPNLTTLGELDDASLDHLAAWLSRPAGAREIDGLDCLEPGAASGALEGGNLSVICSLLGTAEQPDFEGKIVFIEDVGEAPYRLDRLLLQLLSSGAFSGAAGLAFGDLGRPLEGDLLETVLGFCRGAALPCVKNLPIGHGSRNLPLPVGRPARLDADRGRLELL